MACRGTYASLMLASERLVTVLDRNHFTGWTAFPVRVALDGSRELQGYRGLAVTGCGAIDDSLSAEILLPPPVPGGRAGRALRGLCFPPASWDGSDVFTAEDYAGTFVVNRIKEALEAARVTNVEFSRLSALERTWRADGSPL